MLIWIFLILLKFEFWDILWISVLRNFVMFCLWNYWICICWERIIFMGIMMILVFFCFKFWLILLFFKVLFLILWWGYDVKWFILCKVILYICVWCEMRFLWVICLFFLLFGGYFLMFLWVLWNFWKIEK